MLTPIGKRLLIKPAEENSKFGIVLVNHRPSKFIVIRTGEEVFKVCENDTIYLDKYTGIEIEHEGQKYLVIDESNILAKVTKD